MLEANNSLSEKTPPHNEEETTKKEHKPYTQAPLATLNPHHPLPLGSNPPGQAAPSNRPI